MLVNCFGIYVVKQQLFIYFVIDYISQCLRIVHGKHCVCACVRTCACVCVHVCACVSVFMFICSYNCMFVDMHIFVQLHVRVNMFICL